MDTPVCFCADPHGLSGFIIVSAGCKIHGIKRKKVKQ
jgi:hypothetical protein